MLNFDLKLDSKDGKDVHREFKGAFYDDGTLTVLEIITTPGRKMTTQVVVPKGKHPNPSAGGAPYTPEDVAIGAQFVLPGVPVALIVQKVDGLNATMVKMAKTQTVKVSTGNIYACATPCNPRGVAPEAIAVLEAARKKLSERGARTIITIARSFRICDDSGDGRISMDEFHKAAFQYGLIRTEPDFALLFSAFDIDKSGFIDYEEFLRTIRGEMSQFRKELVQLAFKKLDADKNGVIEVGDLQKMYSVKNNPAVLKGEVTEEKALAAFLDSFDTIDKNGIVTYEEFLEYYQVISASIDNDEAFELMMRTAWRI